MVEDLIVGLGGVRSKRLIGGLIRKLTISLCKDDRRVALIVGENKNVGVGAV